MNKTEKQVEKQVTMIYVTFFLLLVASVMFSFSQGEEGLSTNQAAAESVIECDSGYGC